MPLLKLKKLQLSLLKMSKLVIHADCLKGLKKLKTGSADLIYLDPPFFSQRKQSLKTKNGQHQYEFDDRWGSIHEYVDYLGQRLEECHRVLKNTGSLFLHCDSSASHYLRIELDRIFGSELFQSEIIWSYKRWSNSKKGLLNQHQTIFFYTKTYQFKFNPLFLDYSPTTNVDQIVQKRTRDDRQKAIYKRDGNGRAELVSKKVGVPAGDVWEIPFLNPKARERVDYPTQKPILLLERIINLVTNEGDLVVDPFCGSGTTLVAAQMLKRKLIGFDQNKQAVLLAQSRLAQPIKTESQLLKKGAASYLQQDAQLSEVVRSVGGVVVQRNKGIDGLVSTSDQLVPFKVVYHEKDILNQIEQLQRAVKKNQYEFRGLHLRFKMKASEIKKLEKKHDLIIFKDAHDLQSKIQP